jgi:cell division initiation protein
MELSPLEIRSQKFSKKIKGYDVSEVDNFLEIVSRDMEKLYGEYYGLKEELVKKNQEITDYKEKDKSIGEAILMVQSVSNDIKKAAVMEAEAIKRGAVAEAENIIKDANKKYLEITKNIDGLLNKRIVIINSIKSALQTNTDLINREADKNMEISFPAERIKIDISGAANDKTEPPVSKSAEEESASGGAYDLADFLKNDAAASEDNKENSGEKDEVPEKKDMEELLGDINKFTF